LGALWLGGLSEWLGLSLAQAVGCALGALALLWAWRRRGRLRDHRLRRPQPMELKGRCANNCWASWRTAGLAPLLPARRWISWR